MLRNLLAFSALTALLTATPIFPFMQSEAEAQGRPACAPRDKMVEKLAEKYEEARTGSGTQGSKSVFEVWTSSATGSWTILMTRANGMSCIVAAGQNWALDAPSKIVRGKSV